jgi:Concanavalin A-like lectin/glucanases superfamily/Immunoglobulin domain
MKYMRPFRTLVSKINPGGALIVGTALAWLSLSPSALAAEPLYTTTSNQGGSPGTNWAQSIIWKLNGAGTAVGATAGNTYEALYNGTVKLGNGTATTLLRNPYSAGTPTIAVFPGDSLILDTNAQIRFKAQGTSGTTAQGAVPIAYPTNAFNGANGLPGLVLNGGCLNTGDSDAFVILGTMQAAPGTLSYLNPANSFSGDTAKRDFIIAAQLSGSGSLALLNAVNTVPQLISGTSNTFSGTWIVKEGWLQGTGDGTAGGYNSLGTNTACTFVIDPQWTPPPIFDAGAVFTAGPAMLDMGAATANCGGTLILTNGGQLNLHGIVVFGAVTIEGTALAAGTHFYSELITNFASSFSAGGSGAIIVRPYNPVPPALGPTIVTQPLPEMVYAGVTAQFTVSATVNGAPPLTYQWQRAGTNLVDGDNISGSTNATLFVSNVSAADAVSYDVVVRNAGGPVTSAVVPLTVVAPSGEAYEAAVLAAQPVAFYELNETGDPATNNSPAFDFVGGFVGIYGNTVQNGNPLYGIAGPQAGSGLPGFAAGNKAAQFANGSAGARISVAPWNINTNTVTIAAWVNPSGPQVSSSGIVNVRNGTGVATAGLEYSAGTDINGNHTLGYNWDDESPTYNWSSGLTTPPGQWSFVALVVTPTNATIYVINTNGALASTFIYSHRPLAFTTTTQIGDDSYDGGTGTRSFNGIIDNVSVFGSALSPSQIMGLYSAASGGATLAPAIGVQPLSASLYQGQTAQFTALAAGTLPLTYQWQAGATGSGAYTNLADGGRFSGSASPTLSITGIDMPNAADYIVVVTNPYGSVTSSVATLTVMVTNAAENITMAGQEPAGQDWNTASAWSDGLAASVSAAAKPGSTYELLPGSMLRTPGGAPISIFPGMVLTNDGIGVFTNIATVIGGEPSALIRFKQANPGAITNPAVVVFPRLVMNGGEVDLGNDGLLSIQGEIDIISNAVFYVDSGGGANRWYQIDALLTGSASIEYHAFDTSFTGDLNITCPSNTFSGTWNVVRGALLGTGANSLGTNTITVGANAALETTYDIHNPKGSLILNGQMFLHQNDTFGAVAINGNALNPGVYPFATLAATYSNNFPVTWKPQMGAANFSTGSGSLTVLGLVPPTITVQPVASQTLYAGQTAQFSATVIGGQPLTYHWLAGAVGSGVYTNLANGGVFAGTTTTNLTISPVGLGNTADYILVVTNLAGSATSTVATLTVLPTFPAIIPITLAAQDAIGQDWDTAGLWNDGQGGLAASVSALEFPGSTYEVLPGARLRSTDGATTATFPGTVLTIDGNGVYVNNPGTTALVGEFRFKQVNGGVGTVTVPRLVMNGGQLDLGNDGTVIVAGEIDIAANTPFNNNATADRGYVIAAWLTGHGSIEYHGYQSGFQAAYVNNLNIAGTSNTYSGTWNVVVGTLLGTGTNALGTNSITVGPDGALETTYDLNSPNAALTVSGRVYLHQHDTFQSVFVGSAALAPGTYTFAQLNAAYPNNFPATWTMQSGSTTSGGSGSLTVLSGALSLSAAAPVASIGQDISVVASIPPGANSSGPVTVTVANDNPTVVSLPGGNPSLVTVVFGTGAATTQAFSAHALAVGTAHLTASAPGLTGSLPLSLFVRHAPALIGHWTFSDTVNPYAESSGFRPATTHDGTAIGTVALSSDHPVVLTGNSLDLTGGGVLEILNTRTAEAGYLNTFDDEVVAGLSVSAWVKLNSNWNATAWIAFVSKRGEDNAGYQLRRYNTGPDATFTIRGTPQVDDQPGSINYEDGNWHLITGVWDGGAGTRSLYVDGVLDTAASLINDFAPMTLARTNSLVIGGRDHSNDGTGTTTIEGQLLGYLADVRLYNYALSPDQVQSLFNPSYVPPVTLGLQFTNGSLTLSWPNGTLLQATNLTGPWITNSAPSPLTVTPTGPGMFYRVKVQ